MATIQGRAPPAGGSPAGTLYETTPDRENGVRAGLKVSGRNAQNLATALPSDNFCFLTGVAGRFHNESDAVFIDRNDGRQTLRAPTPFSKDRNPGGVAQCVQLDRP